MARGQQRLTALHVTKLTKRGLYGDGGNLWLQVTSTGAKSWLFRFMMAGKQQAMGLGPTHTVSLAHARDLALAQRKLLLNGINPLVTKQQERINAALASAKHMTFDPCAKTFISAHKAGWKNAKHASQWENTLKTYASPVFGHLPVDQVDTTLVVKCLSPIWESKHVTAARLRGRIESVLSWAATSHLRTGENPARWKGHLEHLLPTLKKSKRKKHHPSLPWARIGAFMKDLQTREGVTAKALRFTILTACRSCEVIGARWTEFDIKNKIWTIPAERMKAEREHQVPLSDDVLALLESMPKICELVFPGEDKQPMSEMSLLAVIRRMNDTKSPAWVDVNGKKIVVHGFRSTFRMWAAEATNYPREVAEHALAHQLPDDVERAYQRGTLFVKRVALMTKWAKHCAKA